MQGLGWIVCCVLLGAGFLVGCEPGSVGNACTTVADCASSERCVDSRCVAGSDGGDSLDAAGRDGSGGFDSNVASLVSLEITPANPTVVALDGVSTPVDLDLTANYDDGSSVPITSGFWTVDSTLLGNIDSTTGVFTADGTLAGTVNASVDALGMITSTVITVEVTRVIIGTGVPPDVADLFSGTPMTDAAREATLLYPLEGAVFPQNVFPPDVQWEGGVAGDIYRIRFTVSGVDITAYVIHAGTFTYDWLVDGAAWRALAEAAPESDVSLVIDRYEVATGDVIAGTPRTFRFADAVIRGAIYYWDLEAGRILRIRGDGTGLEAFMPNPPPRPSDGKRCVACHAVSRDGTRMAAELWDGDDFGAVFDLTVDLSVDPAPTYVPPTQQRFLTASFSPDNSRLIANRGNGLFLMDGNTGGLVTAAGVPLPTAGSAHPSWSPDGNSIALATNTNGPWGVDFSASDLGIIDVTGPDTFAMVRSILPGGGMAVARPSWSPDSGWIAFQHGTHSRAVSGGPQPATVRLANRDASVVFDLEALNADVSSAYYPTFSPFDEGGYFWLAFFSSRDYGNAQAGTRGTGRRQLWVSAVSNAPAAGTDPSEVGYWLPQQDVSRENMAAFWAEEACFADGRTCATSGECCSGFCRDVGDGPVCVPPEMVLCSESGEACAETSDCCEATDSCISNTCGGLM